MKKLLLSGCFTLFASILWAQEQKLFSGPPTAMNMQQYWDSVKKKNEILLKKPEYLFKKKTGLQNNNPEITLISPAYINKNVMPVLAPDSDYVFNMPGSHAFDKSKAKGGIIFVTGKLEKLSAIIDKKK